MRALVEKALRGVNPVQVQNEALTPTTCARIDRRDIHRHLTSNAGIPVKSSLSRQHFAVMA